MQIRQSQPGYIQQPVSLQHKRRLVHLRHTGSAEATTHAFQRQPVDGHTQYRLYPAVTRPPIQIQFKLTRQQPRRLPTPLQGPLINAINLQARQAAAPERTGQPVQLNLNRQVGLYLPPDQLRREIADQRRKQDQACQQPEPSSFQPAHQRRSSNRRADT